MKKKINVKHKTAIAERFQLCSTCFIVTYYFQSVLFAMDRSLDLRNVIQCVCYITDEKHLDVVRSVWDRAVQHDEGEAVVTASVRYVETF